MRTSRTRIFATGLLLAALACSAGALAVPAAAQEPRAGLLGTELLELLENQLDRTDEVLERVSSMVEQANRPRALELYTEAQALQKLARTMFDQLRAGFDAMGLLARRDLGQRVLANTQRARDLAREAERMLREETTFEERARQQIERGRRLLDELHEELAQEGDAQRRRLLDQAENMLDTAERQFNDQNFEVALRLADSANAVLRGLAGDREPGSYGRERLEQELSRTRDLLDRAQQREEKMGEVERRRLHDALRLQEQAEEALRGGRPFLALRLSLQARGLARDLLDQIGGQVTQADVNAAMDRFDAKLEQVRGSAPSSLPDPVRALLDQAVSARGRAQEELSRGNFEAALAQLRVGIDLLGRAARLLEAQPR